MGTPLATLLASTLSCMVNMFTQKMKFKSSGTIVINGQEFKGSSVEYDGITITIDGVKHKVTQTLTPANIQLIGDCDTLHSEAGRVVVEGNAGAVSTVSGRVEILGSVQGNVSTVSGRVEAKEILGSTSSVSGSIRSR